MQAVGDMDEDFYRQLLSRHSAGEIDDEELEQLIQDHLDKVDEFKSKVRQKMNQIRRKRAEQRRKTVSDFSVDVD